MNRISRGSHIFSSLLILGVLAIPFIPDPTGADDSEAMATGDGRLEGEAALIVPHAIVKDALAKEVLLGRRPLLPVVLLFREMNARQPSWMGNLSEAPNDPNERAWRQLLMYARSWLDRLDDDVAQSALASLEAEFRWELANPSAHGSRPALDSGELEERVHRAHLRVERERITGRGASQLN